MTQDEETRLRHKYPEAPLWIRNLPTLEEAEEMMKLRRTAFPKTETEQ